MSALHKQTEQNRVQRGICVLYGGEYPKFPSLGGKFGSRGVRDVETEIVVAENGVGISVLLSMGRGLGLAKKTRDRRGTRNNSWCGKH